MPGLILLAAEWRFENRACAGAETRRLRGLQTAISATSGASMARG
jgi:hypothetical protein